MNIIKKAVACFAAVTVMTSMAVTASAEYQISGIKSSTDNKYFLRVVGLPDNLIHNSYHERLYVHLLFEPNELDDKVITAIIHRNADYKVDCVIINKTDSTICEDLKCDFMQFEQIDNKYGIIIEFSADDEYLAEFMKCSKTGVTLVGWDLEDDGNYYVTALYNSNGEEVEAVDDVIENCTVTWETLNSSEDSQPTQSETTSSETTSSEPAPEPVSSEPAPEPVSSEPAPEPVSSEPAPEPVSSEPVSETVISEPTTSQPTNVDTGVTGVAAVVGAAILAAGAVIVTRKKK